MPPLLKPAAQHWRAALLAVRASQPMPALPAAGAATLARDADPRGAALAYRRLGREWLRIDLADRLASHARKVRAGGRRRSGRRRARDLARPRRGGDCAADGAKSASPRPATPGSGAAGAVAPLDQRRATRVPRLRRSWPKLKRGDSEDRPLPALHPAGEEPHSRPGDGRSRPRPHRRQRVDKAERGGPRRQRDRASRFATRSGCSGCCALPDRRGPPREARACYEELGN